jgi:hypothetical protein
MNVVKARYADLKGEGRLSATTATAIQREKQKGRKDVT